MNIEATLNGLVALGATWVLWLLLALSVLAVAVMLERLTFFCVRGSARTRCGPSSTVASPRDSWLTSTSLTSIEQR